ncbi:MAG: hypothetical protein ACOYK8_07930 [Alphaproteobacteria bacterium]
MSTALYQEHGYYFIFSPANTRPVDPNHPGDVPFQTVADILNTVNINDLHPTDNTGTLRLIIAIDDPRWDGHPLFKKLCLAANKANLVTGSHDEPNEISISYGRSEYIPDHFAHQGAIRGIGMSAKYLPTIIPQLIKACEELAREELALETGLLSPKVNNRRSPKFRP